MPFGPINVAPVNALVYQFRGLGDAAKLDCEDLATPHPVEHRHSEDQAFARIKDPESKANLFGSDVICVDSGICEKAQLAPSLSHRWREELFVGLTLKGKRADQTSTASEKLEQKIRQKDEPMRRGFSAASP